MKIQDLGLATALWGALFLTAITGLSAAETCSTVKIKPMHSVSVDAGNTHVAGYFLNTDGVCKLTLMLNEIKGGDAEASNEASRFQLTVEPGRSARFDKGDGNALRFSCLGRAELMTLSKLDRVAGVSTSE